ncbi:penicillin-binding protein 1C [Pleomorphomonas koreensis]|uniref:penicillin-binding protein 1C n=1 Tax=Pleomorphomonas koreensis TaxID=257440 RepID=UPI00040F4DF3|nr:penicillin-binding protein 1C [Pleomorphomonas koreensis]
MKKRHLLIASVALVLSLAAAGAVAVVQVRALVDATPPVDLFAPTSQVVTGRNGDILRAYTVGNGLWRLPVDPARVDPSYVRLLIATEDRRFREHDGVDPQALLRAGWQLLTHGRIVSGGSTLTMQVVRLSERLHTRSPSGKFGQIVKALALERFAGKDDILAAYLGLAPFGGNLEGVRSASLAWFGKEPARLTPAEAAFLVALPQAPEARRPDRDPVAAKAARDRILLRAAEAGVLARADAEAAIAEPVPTRRRDFPILAAQAADRAVASAPKAGDIRLSIDGKLQASLESLAAERASAIGPNVSVAIMVAEEASGDVLASVGSAGLFDARRSGYVDMTRAVRSPGSTLKPFIYGLAFEAGIAHPETLVEDRPTAFAGYTPNNFDKTFRGTVTVRQALSDSLNVPAIQTLELVGPARLISRFRRAGVEARLPDMAPANLAVGLGGVGLTLNDLTTLYTALARGGRPIALRERADAVGPAEPPKPLMDERAAAYVTGILAGPLAAVRGDVRVAVKTGTSYGYRDAWAMGYDGRYVVGVWVGRPDGAPLPGLMGVDVAVPILADSFVRAGGTTRLPPDPPGLLRASNAELPPPLQRLRGARAAVAQRDAGPEIAYPPTGARVDLGFRAGAPQPLALKVRNGKGPFTWFADGAPVAREPWARQFSYFPTGAGFVTLSVVDGEGRADRVTVFVE